MVSIRINDSSAQKNALAKEVTTVCRVGTRDSG